MGSATPVGATLRRLSSSTSGVVIDRRDAMLGEELGEQTHHHLAVLEHVGDARGHAQVVFQNFELAGVIADDVDAGDVRIDAAGDIHPLHLRTVLRVAENLFGGDHACPQDLLLVINVMNERVQRPDALLQAGFQAHPFLEGQHPRDDIEGNQALSAFLLAVDGECNTHPVEQGIGFGAFLRQPLGRLFLQPLRVTQVVRSAHFLARVHLVVRLTGQKSSAGETPPANGSRCYHNHVLKG